MACAELTSLGQRSQYQCGRRHGQRQPADDGGAPGESEREAYRAQNRGRKRHLRTAEAEHGPAQHPQAARLEFESDEEQQQHHAELGELHRGLHLADQAETPRTDQHPGGQIPQHCAQPGTPEERHQKYRGDQEDRGLFKSVHGISPEGVPDQDEIRRKLHRKRPGGHAMDGVRTY